MKVAHEARRELNEINKDKVKTLIQTRSISNPITGRNIAELTGLKSDVTVRAIVNDLRRDLEPVGSGDEGYFWATEAWHLTDTLMHLRQRIDGMMQAIAGLEKAQETMRGLYPVCCPDDDIDLNKLLEDFA